MPTCVGPSMRVKCARGEAAAIVAQPHVIAGFTEVEGEGVVVIGTICTGRLQKSMDHQYREFGFLCRVLFA